MKPRPTFLGTIVSFATTREGYFVTIRRANGQKVTRIMDPEVAHRLAAAYGIRARQGSASSMATLKGVACRWKETSQGLIIELEILPA